MPGLGRKRRQRARQRELAQARRRQRRSPARSVMRAATAVPRAGLDIVTDAAQRTKQLLTPLE